MELIYIIGLITILVLILIGILIYKKRKKKGLDQTDKPPEDIYPLY